MFLKLPTCALREPWPIECISNRDGVRAVIGVLRGEDDFQLGEKEKDALGGVGVDEYGGGVAARDWD